MYISCPNCGAATDGSFAFCPMCGTSLCVPSKQQLPNKKNKKKTPAKKIFRIIFVIIILFYAFNLIGDIIDKNTADNISDTAMSQFADEIIPEGSLCISENNKYVGLIIPDDITIDTPCSEAVIKHYLSLLTGNYELYNESTFILPDTNIQFDSISDEWQKYCGKQDTVCLVELNNAEQLNNDWVKFSEDTLNSFNVLNYSETVSEVYCADYKISITNATENNSYDKAFTGSGSVNIVKTSTGQCKVLFTVDDIVTVIQSNNNVELRTN